MTDVRPAGAADAAAIIAVRFVSWRAAYGSLLPEHVWDDDDATSRIERLAASMAAGRTRAVVADDGDAITGYALYGPARDTDLVAGTGEVYAIYVHPERWASGQGRALLTAALTDLGADEVVLWVLTANARARRFYERAGFLPDGTEKAAVMPGGVQLPELRYRLSTPRARRDRPRR